MPFGETNAAAIAVPKQNPGILHAAPTLDELAPLLRRSAVDGAGLKFAEAGQGGATAGTAQWIQAGAAITVDVAEPASRTVPFRRVLGEFDMPMVYEGALAYPQTQFEAHVEFKKFLIGQEIGQALIYGNEPAISPPPPAPEPDGLYRLCKDFGQSTDLAGASLTLTDLDDLLTSVSGLPADYLVMNADTLAFVSGLYHNNALAPMAAPTVFDQRTARHRMAFRGVPILRDDHIQTATPTPTTEVFAVSMRALEFIYPARLPDFGLEIREVGTAGDDDYDVRVSRMIGIACRQRTGIAMVNNAKLA